MDGDQNKPPAGGVSDTGATEEPAEPAEQVETPAPEVPVAPTPAPTGSETPSPTPGPGVPGEDKGIPPTSGV